jgi:uncharacterized protein YpiB (UPF0302 family)
VYSGFFKNFIKDYNFKNTFLVWVCINYLFVQKFKLHTVSFKCYVFINI